MSHRIKKPELELSEWERINSKNFNRMNKNLQKIGETIEKGDLNQKKLDNIDKNLGAVSKELSDFYY